MSDHGQRHRDPRTGASPAPQAEDPKYVGGGVDADRAWAQRRIRNHFAANRDPASRMGVVSYEAPTSGRIQRKAEEAGAPGAPAEEHGAAAEVSHPAEPAEQEADAVADQVAAKLHDGAQADAGGEPGQEKAPEIGAKLDGVGRKVFRAKWDPSRDGGDDDGRGKRGGKDRRKPGSLGEFKGTDALRQENKVLRDVCVALGLNRDEQRQLHDQVSGQGLGYHEIMAIAEQLFPDKKKT